MAGRVTLARELLECANAKCCLCGTCLGRIRAVLGLRDAERPLHQDTPTATLVAAAKARCATRRAEAADDDEYVGFDGAEPQRVAS